MTDPKVLLLAGLLVGALYVLAVVLGVTGDDIAARDVDELADAPALEALEGALHRIPGLGLGRHLEPADLFGTDCDTGRELEWRGGCVIGVPDDLGVALFASPPQDGTGPVEVELDQQGMPTQRFELPGDLDEDGRLELRMLGDGGRLTLACHASQFDPPCRLLLLDDQG